jgi:hypothetical protein
MICAESDDKKETPLEDKEEEFSTDSSDSDDYSSESGNENELLRVSKAKNVIKCKAESGLLTTASMADQSGDDSTTAKLNGLTDTWQNSSFNVYRIPKKKANSQQPTCSSDTSSILNLDLRVNDSQSSRAILQSTTTTDGPKRKRKSRFEPIEIQPVKCA